MPCCMRQSTRFALAVAAFQPGRSGRARGLHHGQAGLRRRLTRLRHLDSGSDPPFHPVFGRGLHRLRVLERLRGVADASASRSICIKGQTHVVDELLMRGGETNIRDDGPLLRCFDDSRPLPEVE